MKYSTIIVDNMAESIAFYRDILGFTEGYHVSLKDNIEITLMNSPDGSTVELIKNSELPTGFWSVGTIVDNLDEVLKDLNQHGIEHTPVATTTVGHLCFITDPNGVKICLIEHDEEHSN